jgi:hypothetical protein
VHRDAWLVAFGSIATEMARPRRVRLYPDNGLNGRNADKAHTARCEILAAAVLSLGKPVFLIRSTHHNCQRAICQRSLQSLGLIPRPESLRAALLFVLVVA